jgi:guanine deaminase
MTLATPITVIRGRFLDIQKTVAQTNQNRFNAA